MNARIHAVKSEIETWWIFTEFVGNSRLRGGQYDDWSVARGGTQEKKCATQTIIGYTMHQFSLKIVQSHMKLALANEDPFVGSPSVQVYGMTRMGAGIVCVNLVEKRLYWTLTALDVRHLDYDYKKNHLVNLLSYMVF